MEENFILPHVVKEAISDQNMPFISSNPMQLPLMRDDYIKTIRRLLKGTVNVGANDMVNILIWTRKNQNYLKIYSGEIEMRYSFTLYKSNQFRATIVTLFLAITLSPQGILTVQAFNNDTYKKLQLVQQFLQNQAKPANDLLMHSILDITSSISYELENNKQLKFEFVNANEQKNDYYNLGVFYDNYYQQVEVNVQQYTFTPERAVANKHQLSFIGTFKQNVSYYLYIEEIFQYCTDYQPKNVEQTINIQIYDFDNITFIRIGSKTYSVKINKSIKYRRLLIAILISVLNSPDNCHCTISVNSLIIPILLENYATYVHNYKDYSDMDILLVLYVLKCSFNKQTSAVQQDEFQTPQQQIFLGQFDDNFYQQQCDRFNIPEDDQASYSSTVLQHNSEPKKYNAKITKIYMKTLIAKLNLPFLTQYQTEKQIRPKILLNSEVVSCVLEASVYVQQEFLFVQWNQSNQLKLYFRIFNSNMVRRILMGIYLSIIGYSTKLPVQVRIQSSCFQLVTNFLYHHESFNTDIISRLATCQFSVKEGATPIYTATCVGEYYDCQ